MELGALAESLDFDAIFKSISASNHKDPRRPTESPERPQSPERPTDGRQTDGRPSEGRQTEASPFGEFVDAVEAAFEVAFADFVERTSEQSHRTLELAVALLASIAPERGARARERVDLANAVKNASVILFGPITQSHISSS